ncbi:MAG: RluA family pseudouridine synthase [Treponema sp.]|nr:RluA family pseudouridine synthase [Treponema sp.]
MEKELIAGIGDSGRRLDRILRRALPAAPLSLIHRLLRKGKITVNGIPGKGKDRISEGSRIGIPKETALFEYRTENSQSNLESAPAPFLKLPDLHILLEEAGLLILNKPAGLAVHGPGRNCLDALVLAYLRDKLPPSLSFKPGPLHRLDQISSGIIVFSRTLAGARAFSAMMKARNLRKTYLALTDGLAGKAVWEDALVRDKTLKKTLVVKEKQALAKSAKTKVFPLALHPDYSLIVLEIETGLTHQIRSQAAFHGHPLSGDRKYGGSPLKGGPFLHALSLGFPDRGLPIEIEELQGRTISAPLPGPFLRQIRKIFGKIPLPRPGQP